MFAPPMPPSGSRPTSAAGHHAYSHQPYDLPLSPNPMGSNPRHSRSNSYSWKQELGLPPPPSEIDSLGDSLQHALVPYGAHNQRSRSRSPAPRSPSRYDLEFGGLEDPEHRDRTQDHMNMVTKHPKVKIDVVLNSNVFEAGGTISGKLELTCTTSQRLRIGEIAVELEAVEQLSSRDHAATQLFLYNRTMFQGESLPPSNAVLPAAPVNGYWTARKGRTSFPFSFRLPSSAPSCVTFAGNASLRYGLKATVQTWYNEDKMIVTARREAFVLEKWADEYHVRYRQPVEAVGDTRLFMGGNGAVWLEAGVTEQLFWGGGQMLVRCGVKNNTKRHLAGIKVSLARRLIFPVGSAEGLHDTPDKVSLEPRITEIVHEQIFKGKEYEFGPNEETVCNVAVDIPRDLRTIRKTRLFEVRTFALVSLLLGSFAKDLTVEIPIYVAHTASVQRPAQEDLRDLHPSPPQHQLPARPHSSMGHAPAHHHHHHHHPHHHHHEQHHIEDYPVPYGQPDPRMLEVERLAAERGWSPAPTFDGARQLHSVASPSRPASAAPGMIQLPPQAQPFSLSPDGQLQWNPAASSWNLSQFVAPNAAAGSSIQRSVSAAPDVFAQNLVRPAPTGPSLQHQQQLLQQQITSPQQLAAAWQPPQRTMSASPGPQQFAALPHHHAQPVVQQNRRASLPMPGAHGSSFAYAAPPASSLSQVPVPAPAPAPAFVPLQETLPPMPMPMPMPPANAYHSMEPPQQQQPTATFFPTAPPVAGLATIEEDGESQAGTVKTMRNLPTLGKTGTKGAKGNSVSRNNIEQFEAMAEAEEDEEEIKRQMIAMGMQPDEAAFASTRSNVSPVVAQKENSVPAPISKGSSGADLQLAQQESVHTQVQQNPEPLSASTRQTGKSQVSVSSNRPRASDIFSAAQKAREQGLDPQEVIASSAHTSRDAAATHEVPRDRSLSNVSTNKQHGRDPQEYRNAPRAAAPTAAASTPSDKRNSVSSLRRTPSTQGMGLEALESKLARSTTPKIASGSATSIAVMANVGRREVSASPLASPATARDASTRSRKDSALRAAALAREEAERKVAEEEVRAADERSRRCAAEEAARAEAMKEEAARKERERARTLEKQRMDRERVAEQARLERERAEKAERERKHEEEARRQRQAEESRLRRAEAERQAERQRQEQVEAVEAATKAAVGQQEEQQQQQQSKTLSIAPTLPSKTQFQNVAKPGSTTDRDRIALQKQAVGRINGWLSSASSPSPSEIPGTPSGSVISMMKKGNREGKEVEDLSISALRFPSRSPSQRVNPLYEGRTSQTSGTGQTGMLPKSRTMADLSSPTTETKSKATGADDEGLPQLSADLRALIDGSDVKPARKAGTALKDHPIARRISGTGKAGDVQAAGAPTASASNDETKRSRHTSMPSWPRPGLPSFNSNLRGLPSNSTLDKVSAPTTTIVTNFPTAAAPASVSRSTSTKAKELFSAEEKAIVIPSRVEKTLKVEGAKTDTTYDARSARGGRGGRVASVAQLWSKIAGDDEPADQHHLTPGTVAAEDRPPTSPSPSTLKPKARRTSAVDGAPALDFSKKKMSTDRSGVTAIAATFAKQSNSRPESLKSVTAPQFLNTSTPKVVFSKEAGAAEPCTDVKVERRPLPKPVIAPGAVPAPTLVRPTAMRANAAPRSTSASTKGTEKAEPHSRRISTDLLSNFEKTDAASARAVSGTQGEANTPLDQRSVREMMSKVAVDSTILQALQGVGMEKTPNDSTEECMSRLRLQDGSEVKMSGRGTTKAIGENKLKSLRAVWGS